MNDDELLIALRNTVRTEESAARTEGWDLPQKDAAFLERMTDLAMRELSAAPIAPAVQPAQTRFAEPRRLARKVSWALPLAAAAALLFAVLKGAPAAPLARYRVEIVRGSERATRDAREAEQSLSLRPGLGFELTLRPSTETGGPLAASVYLSQGGSLLALPIRVEVTALGVLHVHGNLPDQLDLAAQDSHLVVSVARPEALPTPAVLQFQDRAHGSETFQSFRIEIQARQP